MDYLLDAQPTAGKEFLGQGWAFPVNFDSKSGQVSMARYEEDIWQSLQILFSTSIRERVLQPDYGCNPEDYVFTTMNVSFLTYLEDLIKKNIAKNEPRIKLLGLAIEPAEIEAALQIRVNYEIRKTNSRFSQVYPFYKQEGTNVDI